MKTFHTYYQSLGLRYHGPTNTRGSYYTIDANDNVRGPRIPFDHALSADEREAAAFQAYIAARGWNMERVGLIIGGGCGPYAAVATLIWDGHVPVVDLGE